MKQRRTRRQVVIPSPLKTNERDLFLVTDNNRCTVCGKVRQRHFDIELFRQTNTSTKQAVREAEGRLTEVHKNCPPQTLQAQRERRADRKVRKNVPEEHTRRLDGASPVLCRQTPLM